ncbi:hypothetical protein C8R43DRAFT_700142 [Mycena crocata]|nr:hypothetical protein C8R43DRAFT_700142 [Mycena crocata]
MSPTITSLSLAGEATPEGIVRRIEHVFVQVTKEVDRDISQREAVLTSRIEEISAVKEELHSTHAEVETLKAANSRMCELIKTAERSANETDIAHEKNTHSLQQQVSRLFAQLQALEAERAAEWETSARDRKLLAMQRSAMRGATDVLRRLGSFLPPGETISYLPPPATVPSRRPAETQLDPPAGSKRPRTEDDPPTSISDSTESYTYPKPVGGPGRPNSGGYSLDAALAKCGWATGRRNRFKLDVHAAADKELNTSQSYRCQYRPALEKICTEMATKYNFKADYEDFWPCRSTLKLYLKATSEKMRSRSNRPVADEAVDSEDSD